MSGLWGVPKRQRYLPLLAGPLVDTLSASFLIILLFAQLRGWAHLGRISASLIPPMLLVYLLSLLWQCFFFVRTDFYYVIASLFNCKNLLGDTEAFLRNRLSRWISFIRPVDQSHIPPEELTVIRAYTGVWVIGRLLALSALLFVHVPLLIHYFRLVASRLSAGYRVDTAAYLDALFMATFMMLPPLAGFWLWGRSLVRSWDQIRVRASGG
jgi:hypothetical protein